MKKYVVLQQIGKFSPDVKEQFTEKEDAIQYAKLVKKSHWDRKYAVCEVIEELQGSSSLALKSKLRLLIQDGFIKNIQFECNAHTRCWRYSEVDIRRVSPSAQTICLILIYSVIINVSLNIKHNESTRRKERMSRNDGTFS